MKQLYVPYYFTLLYIIIFRISYIEFLKPFALKRQTHRHGNNMLTLLQHPNAELQLSEVVQHPQQGLTGITAKLRQKVIVVLRLFLHGMLFIKQLRFVYGD